MSAPVNQQVLDINAERSKVTFNPNDLTDLFYGGPETYKRIKELRAILDAEPEFDRDDRYFLGRSERFKKAMAISKKYVELRNKHGFTQDEVYHIRLYLDENLPIMVHEGMFLNVMRTQCSDEQFKVWGPECENYRYLGCYAQTEVGHGSNLSRLETTATLDFATDEWVINSPTTSSAKFWIGSLGKTATHAVVFATMLIKGKNYGAHPFFVQIRSLVDHTPLRGMEIMDLGPKQGLPSVDNGWARFHHVRIPRTNMLMRFSQVTKEGEYIKPADAKLAYSTMTYTRTALITQCALAMARGACIATRYSVVRRQGNYDANTKLEAKVLDYPSVQLKVLPLIANAFATVFSAVWIKDLFEEFHKSITTTGASTLLKDVHVYSSGLKSYCTALGTDGIEEARRAMGGHGFSLFSGMIDFNRSFSGSVTYEGENALLTQQVAKYLLNLYKSVLKDQNFKLSSSSSYVSTLKDYQGSFVKERCQAKSMRDMYDPRIIEQALQHRAARLIYEMAQAEKKSRNWSDLNIQCLRLSKAHVQLFMIENFNIGIEKYFNQPTQSRPVVDKALVAALRTLYHLHVFWTMDREMGELTEDGYLSYEQASWIRQALQDNLEAVRPNAVGFSDCFGFTDKLLNSALGSYDGRAYERLEEMVRREPLNNEGMLDKNGVICGYDEFIRPLIRGEVGEFTGKTLYSKL